MSTQCNCGCFTPCCASKESSCNCCTGCNLVLDGGFESNNNLYWKFNNTQCATFQNGNTFSINTTSTPLNITSNFKYISHINKSSLLLQPNKNISGKFSPAAALQVIKGIDSNCKYMLQFSGAKYDYNFNSNSSTVSNYNLSVAAFVYWGNIYKVDGTDIIFPFIDTQINWPFTTTGAYSFVPPPALTIYIPEGTCDQIIIDLTQKKLTDYDFETYSLVQGCTNTITPPPGVTEATILFVAEAIDSNQPAGVWFIDDVIFTAV